MSLKAYCSFDIDHACSGNEAILKIKSNTYDLMICDYKMPDGDGGVVYKYLTDNDVNTRFVLCSSDHPKKHKVFNDGRLLFHNIEKPGIRKGVESVCQLLAASGICDEDRIDFHSVPLRLLTKIEALPVDVYIKIGANKYVKVFNKGHVIDELDFVKLQQKSVFDLYVVAELRESMFKSIEEMILKKFSTFNKENLNTNDFSSGLSLLSSYIAETGFNQKISSAIMESSQLMVSTITKYKQLELLFEKLLKGGDSYITKHSILMSVFTPMVAKKLKWSNRIMDEKLILASLFHDITLKSDEFETIHFDSLLNDKNFISHATEAAEIIEKVENVPADTHVIILEHHEVGVTGIPKGLPFNKVSPLGLLFSFCHFFIDQLITTSSAKTALENIREKAGLCSQYRIFYQALRELDIYE